MNNSVLETYKAYNRAIISPYVLLILCPIGIINILSLILKSDLMNLLSWRFYEFLQFSLPLNLTTLKVYDVIVYFLLFFLVVINTSILSFIHIHSLKGSTLRHNVELLFERSYIFHSLKIFVAMIFLKYWYIILTYLESKTTNFIKTHFVIDVFLLQSVNTVFKFILYLSLFYIFSLFSIYFSIFALKKFKSYNASDIIKINFHKICFSHFVFMLFSYVLFLIISILNSNIASGMLINNFYISFNTILNHYVLGISFVAFCNLNTNLITKQ